MIQRAGRTEPQAQHEKRRVRLKADNTGSKGGTGSHGGTGSQGAASATRTTLTTRSTPEDWSLMLDALTSLLRQAAQAPATADARVDLAQLRAAVDTGVTALDQLRSLLDTALRPGKG